MTIKKLAKLIINQLEFLGIEPSDKNINDLYCSIYNDLTKEYGNYNITNSKLNLTKTKKVMQGKYFQYYITDNEVIVCNRFF